VKQFRGKSIGTSFGGKDDDEDDEDEDDVAAEDDDYVSIHEVHAFSMIL